MNSSHDVIVIIQARMGSTRLPGKVMLQLGGKSVLAHVVERCRAIPLANEIVIATTHNSQDDIIEQEAKKFNVRCYRGSEHDVLSRYFEAAKEQHAKVIVRVTSDCPLLDPNVSNKVIEEFMADSDCQYCSNTLTRSYPRGLDTEVFSFEALKEAYQNAQSESEREHVTPYIYHHHKEFHVKQVVSDSDFSAHRWTLDTLEDYHLLYNLYGSLNELDNPFDFAQVINIIKDNDHWIKINQSVKQKSV